MSRTTKDPPRRGWVGRSIALGCGLQAALFAFSVLLSGQPVAGVLVWNVQLAVALAGPLKLMGYDAAGKAYHSSTPMHLVAATVGLLAGIALYSLGAWLVLRERTERRGK